LYGFRRFRTKKQGKTAPMIIVMTDANTQVRSYFNARSDSRYRAISGLSMGGGTIYYALRHPGMFASAAPLSATTRAWLHGAKPKPPKSN
jgi:predicted peptidase